MLPRQQGSASVPCMHAYACARALDVCSRSSNILTAGVPTFTGERCLRVFSGFLRVRNPLRRRRRRTSAGRCSCPRAYSCAGTTGTQPRWTGLSGPDGGLPRLGWLRLQPACARSSLWAQRLDAAGRWLVSCCWRLSTCVTGLISGTLVCWETSPWDWGRKGYGPVASHPYFLQEP